MAWTCHAMPASTGRRCGHINDGPRYFRTFQGGEIEYCQGCGCTRHASDLRIVARACDTVLRKETHAP